MSFNIVDLVKDQVKGQLIGHMGNLLGNEGGKATSAVDSMIPALLNGMTGSASTNDGANSLFGAIQDQDDSLLDNMGALLGGGQASTVIDNGNSVLSNLFGSGGLGKLAGAISAFSGVSKGGTSSLMGMLAPILLGVLKRKVMGEGLNASGLASMLTSQSSNMTAALPQGLSDQLSSSGFLSSIGGAATGAAGAAVSGASNLAGDARDAAGSAVSSVSDAAGNARDNLTGAAHAAGDNVANAAGNLRDGVAGAASNARDGVSSAAGAVGGHASNAAESARDGVAHAADAVGDGAKKGGSMFRWLLPLLVLGALAWAAFTYLLPGSKDAATDAAAKVGDGAAAVTDTAKDAAATATDAVTDAASTATDAVTETATEAAATVADTATAALPEVPDATEVGNQITGMFSSATETLGGITDLVSAKAALPALGELGNSVDSVGSMLDKVPAAAQGPLKTMAAEGMGKLQPLINSVMELPGVGAIVSPVLEPIMEKMQEFGG